MYSKIIFLLFVCVCSGYSKRLPLPSYIKACHASDPEINKCALQHGRDAISNLLKGDRNYHIPNMDPFIISSVTVDSDKNFYLVVTDVHLYGLPSTDITGVRVDLVKRDILINVSFEKLNIIGKYDINGKILILPIQGNGDLNITLDGLNLSYYVTYDLETKDGLEYMKLLNGKMDLTLRRAYFKLDNLFNGNKELSAATNKALNDEWEQFIDAIKPAISESVTTVANQLINGLTANIPYNEIFPK